jgi:2,4-dienoyl-CoA reductase-like NADH-dependent reductase (Old Yellow Enzyme family)
MALFEPLQIRDITLRNRIAVSPMCEYSCEDGFANDWHLVHLGSRAVGGAALVMTEATAVSPEARISPEDLGIWKDDHIEFLARIAHFIHDQGAHAGIQLAHAGRKGSTFAPDKGLAAIPRGEGGWTPVAPSGIQFSDTYPRPAELDQAGINTIVKNFAQAAARALRAGFHVAEIHAAHGYLLHEFLSPLSNKRTDQYGGSLENRCRIVREVVTAIRKEWPEKFPLFMRISATDWTEGGWDVEQSIGLVEQVAPLGVDLIDCSTGGNVAKADIPLGPGYQVPFSEKIRARTGKLTGAVGMITEPQQAEDIIASGKADIVLLAREMLRQPYWPVHAAEALGLKTSWPVQYLRAAPKGSATRTPVEGLLPQ